MIDRSLIRQHMDVIASDGERIGKVDDVDATGIKLTKDGSPDGRHHYVDLADVARVDEHVHLSRTRASLFGAAATRGGAGAAAGRSGTALAGNKLLWLILGGLALLALIIALSQCDGDRDERSAVREDEATTEVVTPRVAGAPLREGSLAEELDRFLSSKDGLPRTFTFDQINFDSGTANLREADREDLDDIARVLAAYPESRAAIVGYTDAAGPAATNRELGGDRARAVIAALGQRGIGAKRLEARTGGEEQPVATNADNSGRFENRRTELVILKR